MMEELWKPIPGYEGIYEASNLGQIRSVEGKVTSSARFHHRVWKSRVLKQRYQVRHGNTVYKDAKVDLWKDGKFRTYLVSRLVAMAWVEGYQDGYTVNHIDGNPLNNQADNLEWLSIADNIRHGYKNGLLPTKPCVLFDTKGQKHEFASMMDANRFLGKNYSYLSERIRRGNNIRSETGEIYRISML